MFLFSIHVKLAKSIESIAGFCWVIPEAKKISFGGSNAKS